MPLTTFPEGIFIVLDENNVTFDEEPIAGKQDTWDSVSCRSEPQTMPQPLWEMTLQIPKRGEKALCRIPQPEVISLVRHSQRWDPATWQLFWSHGRHSHPA